MKPLQEAIVKIKEAERQLAGVRKLLGKIAFPDHEDICKSCGYYPCKQSKQFDGTIITHCTEYYKLHHV